MASVSLSFQPDAERSGMGTRCGTDLASHALGFAQPRELQDRCIPHRFAGSGRGSQKSGRNVMRGCDPGARSMSGKSGRGRLPYLQQFQMAHGSPRPGDRVCFARGTRTPGSGEPGMVFRYKCIRRRSFRALYTEAGSGVPLGRDAEFSVPICVAREPPEWFWMSRSIGYSRSLGR